MDNQVIEVLNVEHGQQVRMFFENRGIDTDKYLFLQTKESGCAHRYYGVLNHTFGVWGLDSIKNLEAEIIELPKTTEELHIQRDVLVRNNDKQTWKKRVLLADLTKYNVSMPFVCRSECGSHNVPWRQMKELITEITKAEAEEMLTELKGIEIKIKG